MAVKRGGLAVYPIGSVMRQTGLTGRQIRYYEQMQLIDPTRSKGNQRLYSDADVERLGMIKKLLDEGYNIEGIRTILEREGNRKLQQPVLAQGEGETREVLKGTASDVSVDFDFGDDDDDNTDAITSLTDGPLIELSGPFMKNSKLVSLYPVNNRARLENLLLTKQARDKDSDED